MHKKLNGLCSHSTPVLEEIRNTSINELGGKQSRYALHSVVGCSVGLFQQLSSEFQWSFSYRPRGRDRILKSYLWLQKDMLDVHDISEQQMWLAADTPASLLRVPRYNYWYPCFFRCSTQSLNPLNPELNPICYLLALLGAHHFLHFSRIRVKLLTFRRLMSYMYGAPILDVSRSHTTTQHSR